MRDINEVHIKGRAGKDADVRYIPSGKQITKFSVATGGGKKKDGSGEWPTEWHNIECWDVDGASGVEKGCIVELWGRLKTDSWNDKQTGEKKYKTVIVANKLELAADEYDRPAKPEPTRHEPTRTQVPLERSQEITDADIPF